jgi:hypothetical protein
MGGKRLERIEQCLADLAGEVAQLRQRLEAQGAAGGMTRAEIAEFLDQFRAGETLGEELFGAWAAATPDDSLRGSLRAIQAREGSHARLLAQRLKELGGSASFEYRETVLPVELYAATDRSDAEKLGRFLERVVPETVLAGLDATLARMETDPETQALVRAIACDERATLECLQAECRRLGGGGRHSDPARRGSSRATR